MEPDGGLNAAILGEIVAAAEASGLPPSTAQRIAVAAEQRIRQRLGGRELYVRRGKAFRRDEEIRAAVAAGQSLKHLAKAYRLSERRIRQILKT